MMGRVQKPLVLQMPITSRCNSRCKTCNVWKHKSCVDMEPEALREALKDNFFSEVISVGLNGGEFTLVPNFPSVLEAVLSLPSIRNVNLITNGLLPERLFACLRTAMAMCDKRGVALHVCLSVDGVGAVHERVRGVPNCFAKTLAVLKELHGKTGQYCHSFSVGCTLSLHNIAFARETEVFLQSFEGLRVEYHLAVPNKRIHTGDDYKGYYVLEDSRARLLAAEFFYGKYRSAADEGSRRQYFANYYFLKNKGEGRLCSCAYLCRDVTIDENLDMSLCATASDPIGNLKEQTATVISRSKRAWRERRRIRKEQCESCIHYTYHDLSLSGRWAYIREGLRDAFALEYYNVRSKTSWMARTICTIRLTVRMLRVFARQFYNLIWKLR